MKNSINKINSKAVIFAAFLMLAALAGCDDRVAQPYPDPASFNMASGSPFFDAGQSITGLATDGSIVVGVSPDGDGVIAYSEDHGKTWSKVTGIHDNTDGISINAVTWGAGYFLAGGSGGQAAWSANGKDWYAGVIGPMNPKDIYAVAVGSMNGHSVFVAAGKDGRIAHAVGSPKGPWYMASLTPFGTAQDLGEAIHGVAFGRIKNADVFVAVGDSGKIAFMNDLSGKWYGGRAGTGQAFRSVAYGKNRFVAVGDSGIIKISFDPEEQIWSTVGTTDFKQRPLHGIVYDSTAEQFIVFAVGSAMGYSEYGIEWKASSLQSRFPLGIGAVTCTSQSIIVGGTDGSLAYSN